MKISGSTGPGTYAYAQAYDDKVHPSYFTRRNYTELYYINWYIRSGSVRVTTDRGTLRAGPGDWVFFDPLTTRSHFFSGNPHLVSIWFRIRWCGLDFIPPRLPVRVVPGDGLKDLLNAATDVCLFEKKHSAPDCDFSLSTESHQKSLFHRWLSEWYRYRERSVRPSLQSLDARVVQMMAFLGAHPGMAPMDYDGLVRHVGLSRAQCNRLFKQATGMTPRQWCDARCFDQAQEQVRSRERSVKEIASALGFFDTSHFIKWFKSRTGETPSAWRHRHLR